jgi:CrcB protein
MQKFVIVLCIGFGGGLGAAFRHLIVELVHGFVGWPSFVAVMIVNVLGSFLIGVVFVALEGALRRSGKSRLCQVPFSRRFEDRKWWPHGDPTIPLVEQFRFNLHLDVLTGFVITGFLGGMTTFSLFSLLSLNLIQAGTWWWALVNGFGTLLLGLAAVIGGFYVGEKLVPRH